MKERKCPFLETTTVTYCKAFPVKMIPVDRMSTAKGICNTTNFQECSLYCEVSHTGKDADNIRGITLKPEYYYHPKHLWVALSPDDETEARVGIDDFAARLVGRVHRLSSPGANMPVKENSVCFLLHSGERTVRMVAPATGTIKAVNPKVTTDPSILNTDPYNEGWIYSMRIRQDAVNGLYHENVARKWMECEVERLQKFFASDLGMTSTDGGETIADISGRLNEAQWVKIVSQFLG